MPTFVNKFTYFFLHPNINQLVLLLLFRLSVYFCASGRNRASTEFIPMEYRFRVRVIFVFPFDFFFCSLVCVSSCVRHIVAMPSDTGKICTKFVFTQNVQRHVHESFQHKVWCVRCGCVFAKMKGKKLTL